MLVEIIALLDALGIGQAAKRTIEQEAEFGRSAFGADWRGERSSSAPLFALVEWMRSLRGLGAEPRLIAARSPHKPEIGSQAERVHAIVTEVSATAAALWGDLGEARMTAYGDVIDISSAALTTLLTFVSRMHEADMASSRLLTAVPSQLDVRRALLAQVVSAQQVVEIIKKMSSLGEAAFGAKWVGVASDWALLTSVADWIQSNRDIRMLVSRLPDREMPRAQIAQLTATQRALEADLSGLFDHLALDRIRALGAEDLARVDIAGLHARLVLWSASGEQLFQWVAYRDRAEKARSLGCEAVVTRLADGRLSPTRGIPAFEMAYYEAVYAGQVSRTPELGKFDGTLHGALALEFAEMDRLRIAAASYEVVKAHHKGIPARDGGSVGPLGVLRAEIARKRGHMPIRKLMEKAGPAVQAIKPVFMMSPLSVAQFLAPGVFDFDLLVMDEASQIQPVDALGAVARAKQVVVVGDPKQLPPTAFFTKMTNGGNDDEDDDSGSRVADIESILGLFSARGLPTRMLRWHYRSRHQSLIAVSNRQFYENKLLIVPSPYTAEAGMGLRFNHIPQGLWDAGGTRTNAVEARVVAHAIVAHARDNPEASLGVATFSTSHRRAILEQLELLRRTLPPEVEAFFQAHPSEPFFVKNLENVQGDERDVIFISVGYGPTIPGGRVPMRFGPLGSEGGERRLNVLISRAKQRCEVFASMSDEDIEADFAQTRKGIFAFKLFLHFARTGRMTIVESAGRDHERVFEEQVAKALQNKGYQVHRQVGLAGLFVDLAIADSDRPGRYLLGIECDGTSYFEARSARDRDRLRHAVLETHGWAMLRLWSTDWFQRPNQQLELIIDRIESAKAEHDMGAAHGGGARRAVPIDIVSIEREAVTEIGLVNSGDGAEEVIFYEEATLQRPEHITCELHETPSGVLALMAETVATIEGPVHRDEIVARIRAAWGLKRAGGRIQDAVETAIRGSVAAQRLIEDGDFLSRPNSVLKVRNRGQVRSSALRHPEALPPVELELAAMNVIRSNFGATEEQICTVVSRALGFKSTSSQLRDVILSVLTALVAKEWLINKEGILVAGPSAPIVEESRPVSDVAELQEVSV